MKMKFVRNGRTGRRELLVAAQRGESLHVKRADKLAQDPSALLLEFSYETPRGGLAVLHYDVEGLWSLRTYLAKRAMSVEELMGLMQAMQGVLDLCAQVRLPAEGLLFDPEYVFVDAQCYPHFALVPLDDVPFQTRNSPLALLSAIGDVGKLRFATPDAMGLARRLSELVVDLDGVFSANRFRRFVDDEQRQGGQPQPVSEDEEPSTGSVWASAGSTAERGPADDGMLFWSPLAGLIAEEPAAAESVPDPAPAAVPAPQPAPAPAPVADPQPAPQVQPVATPVPQPAPAPTPLPLPVPEPLPGPVLAPTPQPAATLVRLVTGESFALPLGRQVRVGRGSACDIRLLGNRTLSRAHVALTNTGQMFMVTDLGAANGVFVDGQRVGQMQSVLMTPSQRLRLADEEFEVRMG